MPPQILPGGFPAWNDGFQEMNTVLFSDKRHKIDIVIDVDSINRLVRIFLWIWMINHVNHIAFADCVYDGLKGDAPFFGELQIFSPDSSGIAS